MGLGFGVSFQGIPERHLLEGRGEGSGSRICKALGAIQV